MKPSVMGPALGIDLLAESLSHPIALSFQTSTSTGYALAVGVAQQATRYVEVVLTPKKRAHFAVFSSDAVQVARARAVVSYVGHLKATRVYAAGRALQFTNSIMEVLDCYLSAQGCTDWRAHCFKVMPWPNHLSIPNNVKSLNSLEYETTRHKRPRVTEYLLPCRLVALRAGYGLSRLSFNHPAGIDAQIQSLAVDVGCSWCPRFDPTVNGVL